jgi:hypothetical protein
MGQLPADLELKEPRDTQAYEFCKEIGAESHANMNINI